MMDVIRAGSAVAIGIDVFDELLEPPALVTPAGGVTITLHPPSGASPVVAQPMTNTTVGHYTYQYQSSTADPQGLWTVEFAVTHTGAVVLVPIAGGFVLVA